MLLLKNSDSDFQLMYSLGKMGTIIISCKLPFYIVSVHNCSELGQ